MVVTTVVMLMIVVGYDDDCGDDGDGDGDVLCRHVGRCAWNERCWSGVVARTL